MDSIFADFADAHHPPNGHLLASTLSPISPPHDPGRLHRFHRASTALHIHADLRNKLQYSTDVRLSTDEAAAWLDVFLAYYKFVGLLLAAEEASNLHASAGGKAADWVRVYDGWREVANQVLRGYQKDVFESWTIPCLYLTGKYLRVFAIKADMATSALRDTGMDFGGMHDDDAFGSGVEGGNEKLEDAARQINRIFSLCISDRSPPEYSRKWALYYTTALLFKTYFKLNSIPLSKNILRSLEAGHNDMPPAHAFPKSHQVTFKYYLGVIHFLEEDYKRAEAELTEAYNMCLRSATSQLQLILTYLIPTRLLTSHTLPSAELLAPYPSLAALFGPISTCIRRGNLAAFDAALAAGEDEFVKRRIYLTLERGRDIAMRNLFCKAVSAPGSQQRPNGLSKDARLVDRSRVPVKEFAAALQMVGAEVGDGAGGIDSDEVECLIANLISKGLMKGYISREHGMVVLSRKGAFPGLPDRAPSLPA